jgi:hypothetical protein
MCFQVDFSITPAPASIGVQEWVIGRKVWQGFGIAQTQMISVISG